MESFDDLSYGDKIEYVGPDDVEDGYSTPLDWQQPYRFCHTFAGGGFKALTKFGGKKLIPKDHPINDPSKWRRAGDDQDPHADKPPAEPGGPGYDDDT